MLEPTNYQIGVLMRCMILMMVAIGLNVLIGHAGLVSLGQAALYGLGSYVAAWLAVRAEVPFLPAIGAGVARGRPRSGSPSRIRRCACAASISR